MKTKLLSLTFALIGTLSYSQTYINDLNFEAYLESIGKGDGNVGNHIVNTAQISALTSLDISNKSIADLGGIEEFTSLQTFNCSFNSFSTLILPNGDTLLELTCQGPNITNVDAVSTHTALTKIDIKYGNVSSLNVDALVNLEYLDIYDNSISTLNLMNNSALTYLDCYRNGLTILNLSNNPNLGYLNCIDNNLSTLDLSSNTSLAYLYLTNCINLTSITLPDTPSLLYIEGINLNSLTALDVSNNENLYYLDVRSGGLQNPLDLSNNGALTYLDCSSNSLTGLTLPVSAPLLSEIHCNNNMIPSLNLGGCTGLTYLDCSYNHLGSLDVSSNTALQELYCYNNNTYLTSITANNNPVLFMLSCGQNSLPGIDVSMLSGLQYLYCPNNLITDIDLSSNANLLELFIRNNQLTELDLSNNMVFEWLNCEGNLGLSNLTLPNTSTLYTVWAYGNALTDISFLNALNYTGLLYFDVGKGNQTSLDVSMMPNLIEFYCNDNPSLTSLDISNGNNDDIIWMWAYNTALTCIQVDNKISADGRDTYEWQKPGGATYEEFCATAGVDDVDMNSILLYPNPVKNKLYLDLKLEATYSLSNVYGQEIQKGRLVSGSNELDIERLPNGLYLLNLETPEGKATKKIIKE